MLYNPTQEEYWEIEKAIINSTCFNDLSKLKSNDSSFLENRKKLAIFQSRKEYYRDKYNLDLIYETKPIINKYTGNEITLAVTKVRW